MKSFITKRFLLILLILVAAAASWGMFGARIAHAQIGSGSVSCATPNDCVAGAANVSYSVSFRTDDSSPANNIEVSFPSDYVTSGAYASIHALDGTAGSVTVNGVDVPINSSYANGGSGGLAIDIALNSSTNLSTGTVAFTISGNGYGTLITNPSTPRTTGDFRISTDASGETPETTIPGVVITSPYSNVAVAGATSADLVAGNSPVEYHVSFNSAISFSNGSSVPIAVTFPSGYSLTQGMLGNNVICADATCDGGNSMGKILFGGTYYNSYVQSVSTTGNTLTVYVQDYSESAPETISFYIMGANGSSNAGITNPDTSGTTGDFTVTANGTPLDASGVTLTPPPNHTEFTTEPSCTGENDGGKCVSGQAFTVQPVVEIKNYSGVLDTGYDGNVTLSLSEGDGTLTGTTTVAAVNGVATFAGINYHASTDNESFALEATAADGSDQNETGMASVTSSTLTSDVVATRFVVQDNNDGQMFSSEIGSFDVIAEDADGKTDQDYVGTGKTFTFNDQNGQPLSSHLSPSGTAPIIPSSSSFANSFSSGEAFFTPTLYKAEALGPITVSDGTLSGTSDSVSVYADNEDPGSFLVTPSTTTPTVGVPFSITVTAIDHYQNVFDAANSPNGTPIEDPVFITTTASAPYNISPEIYTFQGSDDGTKVFTDAITLNKAETGISVGVRDLINSATGDATGISVSAAPTAGSGGGGGGGGGGAVTPNQSVIINGGAAETNSPDVVLTLYSPDAAQVMISNTADFTGANWQVYQTTVPWVLPDGNEYKNVYVEFRNSVGNVSSVVSGNILLNSSLPTLPSESASAASPQTPQGSCPNGATLASDCGNDTAGATIAATAGTTATAAFTKNLKSGVDSPDVKLLQKYLRLHGFPVTAAGKETDLFGPSTRRELALFQKSVGLVPDGLFGSKTRAYVNAHP